MSPLKKLFKGIFPFEFFNSLAGFIPHSYSWFFFVLIFSVLNDFSSETPNEIQISMKFCFKAKVKSGCSYRLL